MGKMFTRACYSICKVRHKNAMNFECAISKRWKYRTFFLRGKRRSCHSDENAYTQIIHVKMEEKYEKFFRDADTNNDGQLTLEELTSALRHHGYTGSDEDIQVGMT